MPQESARATTAHIAGRIAANHLEGGAGKDIYMPLWLGWPSNKKLWAEGGNTTARDLLGCRGKVLHSTGKFGMQVHCHKLIS